MPCATGWLEWTIVGGGKEGKGRAWTKSVTKARFECAKFDTAVSRLDDEMHKVVQRSKGRNIARSVDRNMASLLRARSLSAVEEDDVVTGAKGSQKGKSGKKQSFNEDASNPGDSDSGRRAVPRAKNKRKKRLRSRNRYIDEGLEHEDGTDHYADLEGFVVADEDE